MLTHTQLSNLYRIHGPSVFRRACLLLGNEAEAHEIVQDLFLSLFERPGQFSGQSTMTTFLYSATTHACLNRLRNERNRDRLRREHSEQLVPSSANREPAIEQQLTLRDSLGRMPEELARVAVFYFVDGLTQKETARVLKCSRRHIGDLLRRLRQWSEEEYRDGDMKLKKKENSC